MNHLTSRLCAALFLCAFASGAANAAQWAKTYGDDDSEAGGIIPIAGGGYYLHGVTNTADRGQDFLFGRLDASGTPSWAKQIGGTRNDSLSVEPVADGFLVTGTSKSFPAPGVARNNIVWAKFDSSWNQLYAKVLGGAATDETGSFIRTGDGGLLFTGSRATRLTPSSVDSDILLVKVRPNGTLQWKSVLDYGLGDSTSQAMEVSDGYVVTGVLQDPVTQTWGLLVMKVAKAGGGIVWKTLYRIDFSSAQGSMGAGGGIKKLSGGNFLVSGALLPQNPFLGGVRVILAKIDSSGSLLWSNSYGSSTASVAAFNIIENIANQTLLVSGSMIVSNPTSPNFGNSSVLAMNLESSSGAVVRQKRIGATSEFTSGVVIRSGTTLYLSGEHAANASNFGSHSKVVYAKLSGTTYAPLWANTFGGTYREVGAAGTITNGFVLGGTSFSFGYSTATKGDIFGITLDATGNYPNCFVEPITLSTTNAGVTAQPLALETSSPTLTPRTIGAASSVVLAVDDATLASTDICSPIE